MVGAALARHEGSRVLGEWREAVEKGELPREGVVSSLLVLVGGVLLVTPGIITDAIGLTLLIPPSRRLVAGILKQRLARRFELNTMEMGQMGPGGATFVHFGGHSEGPRRPGRGGVIDVEATPVAREETARETTVIEAEVVEDRPTRGRRARRDDDAQIRVVQLDRAGSDD